jgi:hypothetical protein
MCVPNRATIPFHDLIMSFNACDSHPKMLYRGAAMTEYAVDTGLIRELRGIQEQVAKELGQLVEKRETKISLEGQMMSSPSLYAFLSEPVGSAQSGD